jgi:hypothetical protein
MPVNFGHGRFPGKPAQFVVDAPQNVLPVVTGAAAITEANDTLSATATVLVSGSLTVTEANDTLSATATVLVSGTLSVTEVNDILSATATVLVSGTLSVTEANDTLSAAGAVGVSGTLAVTEASDALSSTGTVLVAGTLSVTEAADTLNSTGTILVSGTLSATEAADTLSATGTVSGGLAVITGVAAFQEASDVLSAAAHLVIQYFSPTQIISLDAAYGSECVTRSSFNGSAPSVAVGSTLAVFIDCGFNFSPGTPASLVFTRPDGKQITVHGALIGTRDVPLPAGIFAANTYGMGVLDGVLLNQSGLWQCYLQTATYTSYPKTFMVGTVQ